MEPVHISIAAAGVAAGVLGGLLGIGAGSLMVPVLIFYFAGIGIGLDQTGLLAVATSLLAIIFVSTRAYTSHRRRGVGSHLAVTYMAPASIVGALAGAQLALLAGGVNLVRAFALLELIIGLKFLRHPGTRPEPRTDWTPTRDFAPWAAVGVLSGLISSFFGVGGGIVAVPLQVALLNVPIHWAVANSSGLIVINAVVGTGRYMFAPPPDVSLTTIGWGDPASGLILGIAALAGAPLGVALAHRISPQKLRQVFGAFLIVISIVLATRTV